MTIEEFNNTRFGAGMLVEYNEIAYPVHSVCFTEKLLRLVDIEVFSEEMITFWVRCESVTLL